MKSLMILLITLTISGQTYGNIVQPSEESLDQDMKYSHTSLSEEEDSRVADSKEREVASDEDTERELASESEQEKQESIIKFWSY